MNETNKTAGFLVAAAVILAAAFVGGRPAEFDAEQLIGEKLTDDFEVDVPKRLEIVSFDQQTASQRQFEVAEREGLWRIPSKQGYPADATDQMAEAATCLVNREVLRVASTDANQHEEFGVVDPSSSKIDSNSEGVGTRVTMYDSNEEKLIDLVIGNEVKETEGQHYVRRANQNVVFVVELDPDKLSTNFEDWIEDDLLKLNPFDIRHVRIHDYSFDLVAMLTQAGIRSEPKWDRRGEYAFSYNNDDSKWSVEELRKFEAGQEESMPDELGEAEEVNEDALRELRTALDDLKIVDVERKPEGLSGSLKAGEELIQNQEAADSLFQKGFTPVRGRDNQIELLSSEGEVTCTTREGVKYVLRFGGLKLQTDAEGQEQPAEPTDTGDEGQEDDEDGIHRYLFVMVEFDEQAIEKPELEELPELPAGAEDAGGEGEQSSAEADDASASESEGSANGEENAEAEEGDEANSADADQQAGEASDVDAAIDDPAGGAAEEDRDDSAEADSGEQSGEEAADVDQNASDDNSPSTEDENATSSEPGGEDADEEANSEENPAEDDAGEDNNNEEDLESIIARRKSIESENQRKLDEYQDTIEKGKETVQELNERFSDWYYVIDNEVYKKIHLDRNAVIKTKEGEEGDESTDSGDAGTGLPNIPFGGAGDDPT